MMRSHLENRRCFLVAELARVWLRGNGQSLATSATDKLSEQIVAN